MDWSLFAEFDERRRGYRLQDELDVFLSGQPAERAAQVVRLSRDDLRHHGRGDAMEQVGARARLHHAQQAHGSPGNWLDLYAAADIPETEMFHLDRNKLISKFASSAAHVSGKQLVGAETGTWLCGAFHRDAGGHGSICSTTCSSGREPRFLTAPAIRPTKRRGRAGCFTRATR